MPTLIENESGRIGTEFFECACYSSEHTLKFTFDIENYDEEKTPTIYTTIFLNQYRNIFKRIWVAIRYVFGYRCKYGDWDCWLLRSEDVDRLIGMLNEYKAVEEENKNVKQL